MDTPANKGQARELVPLCRNQPDEVAGVWQEAQQRAAGDGRGDQIEVLAEARTQGVTGAVLMAQQRPPRRLSGQ